MFVISCDTVTDLAERFSNVWNCPFKSFDIEHSRTFEWSEWVALLRAVYRSRALYWSELYDIADGLGPDPTIGEVIENAILLAAVE